MSKPILYQIPYSSPSRSVCFVATALGIELEKKEICLRNGDQLTPEFIKMNPQHTVPTLDDNGYILWESNVICTYLIDKYAKDDKLYPKDLQIRATINQRLLFNASIVFPSMRHVLFSVYCENQTGFVEAQLDVIRNCYNLLNAMFRDNIYLVGNSLTVADLCTVTNVSQVESILPIDDKAYPNIRPWMNSVAAHIENFDEINTKVVQEFCDHLKAKIEENKAAAQIAAKQ